MVIAIAGHAAVIGTSTVLVTRTSENPKPPEVVDNSRELVRLSRRVAQTCSVAAVGLNLSETLPPPPAPNLDQASMGTKRRIRTALPTRLSIGPRSRIDRMGNVSPQANAGWRCYHPWRLSKSAPCGRQPILRGAGLMGSVLFLRALRCERCR